MSPHTFRPKAFRQFKFPWLILVVSLLVVSLCFQHTISSLQIDTNCLRFSFDGAMEHHPIESVHNYKQLAITSPIHTSAA